MMGGVASVLIVCSASMVGGGGGMGGGIFALFGVIFIISPSLRRL
jgi:hypothetical protein